jgi:predicted P-loop ATPase
MEIKGSVPWNHPSKYWRDADDAQLISYIDSNYGTFSQRNYQIAVAKVTDDRSYHPIREYLDSLPEWDKVPRLDTLLIDYLGADDNKYVRAVTRKTLCAAISRVQNPGCKFDSMLVLNGPQGVGKSTLISKLAGEWFSDSLNLGDTKDKTAAEKLQGYWILEIGELAGLRKAEVETLRSFLSRQNDIYRAAFGKRATPHQRQCIFFGTTNAESGYLRDTTGNRRFWPVKTPGGGSKHSWQITAEEIQQIWAEALVYVKAGEKLYLDSSMEQLAKVEQRDAMESDEREGLVREYLDTLLPDDWEQMDLFERRNFLSGVELGGIGRTGTNKRQSVCNMEIWCECFGKDRSNLKRTDSNELSAILIKLDWERLPKKDRTTLYGPQYMFVPKSVPRSVPGNS